MITIGIDPHKSSLTAMAMDISGVSVATIRLAVTTTTVDQLQQWAASWPQRRWAVEGAEGLGRGVAQGLAAADKQVVDVPAQLAARARLLNSGHARKTDALDAASVAAVALHHPRLRVVRAEDQADGSFPTYLGAIPRSSRCAGHRPEPSSSSRSAPHTSGTPGGVGRRDM